MLTTKLNIKTFLHLEDSEIVLNKTEIKYDHMNYHQGLEEIVFVFLNSSLLLSYGMELANINDLFVMTFLRSEHSLIIFEKLLIDNLIFQTKRFVFLLLDQTKDDHTSQTSLVFLNCSISEVFGNFQFLLANQYIDELLMKDSSFKNFQVFNNIIEITQFSQMISIENSYFAQNFVLSNIFTKYSELILMYNVTCFRNNNRNDKLNVDGGSCLHFYQSTGVKADRITIISSFSRISALVVIISKNRLSLGHVLINQGMFLSNHVLFVKDQINMGGVLLVWTDYYIRIERSIFVDNKLEMERLVVAHGPCMEIISKNIVEISKSLFKRNKSSKFSNCIYALCTLLSITGSIFSNNSISYLQAKDYEMLLALRTYGSEFFDVEGSKGGAIFFSGNTILINYTTFKDNKANVGSAIFIEDETQKQEISLLIKIENSLFHKNHALWSSLIAFNIVSSFDCMLKNSLLGENYGFNGAIMNLKLRRPTNIILESNYFFENKANLGPVIYLDIGPLFLNSMNNTFRRNEVVGVIASVAYILNAGAIAFLENEKYFENYGFHGVNEFYGSTAFEKNGYYVKNQALLVSGVALTDFAIYFGKDIKFISNSAQKFGCVASLDTSEIYIESSIFFNSTSEHRASCILIQQYTKITVVSTVFYLNYNNSINMIDFETTIELNHFKDCVFIRNMADSKVFDLVYSNVLLENCKFISMNGTIFSLMQNSNLTLTQVGFKNIFSNENLINIQKSSLYISETFFIAIFLKGSLVFSDFSYILSHNVFLKNMRVAQKGAFIDAVFSEIILDDITLIIINDNCFYLYFCYLIVENLSYINIDQELEVDKENLGIIYAKNSEYISITNSCFLGNNKAFIGNRFIYLVNNFNKIVFSRIYFIAGSTVSLGGAMFISDSNLIIRNCYFKANRGRKGGSIFIYSSLSNI